MEKKFQKVQLFEEDKTLDNSHTHLIAPEVEKPRRPSAREEIKGSERNPGKGLLGSEQSLGEDEEDLEDSS